MWLQAHLYGESPLIMSELHHFDESRRLFAPYGFTCECWEAVPASRPDSHNEIEINFLDQGTLTLLLGGERVTIQPRTFSMFWAAIPHQVIGSCDVTFYYVVTIPFELFLQWNPPSVTLTHLIMGEVLEDSCHTHIVSDGLLFEQWHRDLERSEREHEQVVQLEMAARILRCKSMRSERDPDGWKKYDGNMDCLRKAEMMACYIARHYRSQIRVPDIAAVVDLHPDYASTLFRKTFGITLTSLITRHRIAESQRRLLTTDDSILQISHASGFETLSRFNRAFKDAAGITPREYRKQKRWITPGGQTGEPDRN